VHWTAVLGRPATPELLLSEAVRSVAAHARRAQLPFYLSSSSSPGAALPEVAGGGWGWAHWRPLCAEAAAAAVAATAVDVRNLHP
jgi:hypothetical protein